MFSLNDEWIYSHSDFQRIDIFLCEKSSLSRSQIQLWIKQKCFSVNGKIVNKNFQLQENDFIKVIQLYEIIPTEVIPQKIKLDIVFEDQYLAVIHKPKGMAVHPGAGNYKNTLANALVYHYQNLSNQNSEMRPGIVHRLDKNTTGLLVIAKDNNTHQKLSDQIQTREMKRTYSALIWRHLDPQQGTIEQPIKRDSNQRLKMCVHPEGKTSITHYSTLENFLLGSFLKINLETGRTHQIRVHLNHLNSCIMGDPLYLNSSIQLQHLSQAQQMLIAQLKKILSSQALHATKLSFTHPNNGKSLNFETPLPIEMEQALNILRQTTKKY